MRRWLMPLLVVAISPSWAGTPVFVDRAQTIAVDPRRGVDRRVDYAALAQLGPWDDHNYQLTHEDLAVLPAGEAELVLPLPAFFRAKMRQEWPTLQRSGPAQYPRHAVPTFMKMFGGYSINGRLYKHVERADGRFLVVTDEVTPAEGDRPSPDFSGEVRITSPNGDAETAIKLSPVDPNKVIAGSIDAGANTRMWWSTNGGTTWTLAPPLLGSTNGDPAVDWSANGSFAYTTSLGNCGFSGCQVWFYRSADGGKTWTSLESATPGDPRREVATARADKEYLHVDKSSASPFKDRIYITWHDGNVMKFSRSADFGNTFTNATFSNASAELGIGSDITTARNGNVFYVWPAFNSRTIRLKRSTDGGANFANSLVIANTNASYDFPIPAMESRHAFVYTSADADLTTGSFGGSVYVAWTDSTAPTGNNASANHARIQVARSRDNGATWQVTTPHEISDATTVDRFHPWLAVGPDGVVHVTYYDTRRSANRTAVDQFYSFSTDGAVTWSTPRRVTTVLSPNVVDGFEWGDYNGLDISGTNLIAIYTDNRNESGGGGDSIDVYGIGITAGGIGGGAGNVPDGRFVVGPELLVSRAGATDIKLDWGATCGAGNDYATYEGDLTAPNTSLAQRFCSTGGARTVTFTPASGARYYLVVALSGGNEGSYGRKSDGTERPPAASPCLPQQVVSCP